jgi:hypothetical protein
MKYPAYRLSQGRAALANHKEQRKSSLNAIAPETRNAEGDLDPDDLEDLFATVRKACSPQAADKLRASGLASDAIEGRLSLPLYSHLNELPARALGDPDFWRFFAVEVLRDFVFWRDGMDCSQASFGLGSARRIPDCVPLRMFNRAHLATTISHGAPDPSAEEIVVSGGADFWQSHIFRVQNRHDPRLVKLLVEGDRSGLIPNVEVLRQVAKDIKQRRANIVLELQNEVELVGTLKEILD